MFRKARFRVFILFPLCVLCLCVRTCTVCVHGVGAQRICVARVCVCVCMCVVMGRGLGVWGLRWAGRYRWELPVGSLL